MAAKKRDERITVRLTKAELKFVDDLQKNLGLSNRSEAIRVQMFSFLTIMNTKLKDLLKPQIFDPETYKNGELTFADMLEVELKYAIRSIKEIIEEEEKLRELVRKVAPKRTQHTSKRLS